GLQHLGQSTTLKNLWLQHCKADDDGLRSLALLPLERLGLLDTQHMTWDALRELGPLTRLSELQVPMGLGGAFSLEFLDNVPAIETLMLAIPDIGIGDSEWDYLGQLKHLRDLTIGGVGKVNDTAMRRIVGLNSLRRLVLTGPISDEGLKLLARLDELKEL